MYLTVQWCIHVFYLNANWTYKMLEYCTLQSIWYIFVMNHCYPYLNVYMHTFALFCTIIAPCYDMLFLIRTRGLINHPWFLAPLAYTDLCYSLDLCNNWGELFTCMLHSVLFFIWCMYMSIKNLNLNLKINEICFIFALNIPALVEIMASRRPGGKPLSEPMVVSLLTHICITRPPWVKVLFGVPHQTGHGENAFLVGFRVIGV